MSFSSHSLVSSNTNTCQFCQGSHIINNCDKFLQLSISNRIQEIKGKRLCLNCFGDNHISINCKAPKCPKCKSPHNNLLHLQYAQKNNS
ncbi:hypothetical protein NQ314_014125 [Rhamnusium bicolor]|uniref:Uncharacterized protein n=1 Tax=Rhamnusium bicolor TaxID=1586634 RepID=A0AAV8X5S6_9CUCU|nr:hypothetical protein NQ314_014125 [Rhamnusium bicolor]